MKHLFYHITRGATIICLLAFMACKKSAPVIEDYDITLSNSVETLLIGDTLSIKPIFNEGKVDNPAGKYNWRSEDPSVASIKIDRDLSVTIIANNVGVTRINFISIDKMEVLATCEVTVEAPPDGITRILAIGNSFSVDAIENYLHDLAKASDIPVIIGNLAIAGGDLDQHLTNVQSNASPYNYTKIDENGTKTTTINNSIETILTSERWDYISFQQVSQNSGMYATFVTPLPALLNYVKQKVKNPNVKYVLHQTWAYAKNSTHSGFANYNNDQIEMYEAIVDAYNKASQLTNVDIIIPSGTAIQNGRTSFIGDNFTKDGYHLEESYGRYTSACAWFEKLFGESVIGNTFKPTGISEYKIEMAQHAAHFAVLEPDKITTLDDYQQPDPSDVGKGVLQLSFGLGSGLGWNNLTFEQSVDGTIPDLVDKLGNSTGVSVTVLERFGGRNDGGAASSNTSMNLPASVGVSSLYGNSRAAFNGLLVVQSVIKFSGLDKSKKYDFCFFGSRMSVSDNRETKYIVKGTNEESVSLNTSNNTSNVVCVMDIQPTDEGDISVTITMGAANNNSNGFYYINALSATPK